MPGYTNVFDYLTKVQQWSGKGCNTASLVFTVRTLVRDSASCPSLTATPGGELSPLPVLLGVIAFTLLVLKNPIILKIIQSQFHNSSFTTFMQNTTSIKVSISWLFPIRIFVQGEITMSEYILIFCLQMNHISYSSFSLLFCFSKGNQILLWASHMIQSMKPLTSLGFFSPPFHVPGLLVPHRSRSWSSCVAWVQRSYWARPRHMSSDSVQWTGPSQLAAPEHERHPRVLRNK